MPTYSGSFPLSAQGHAVTVKLNGVSLTSPAPGSVGSTVRNGQLDYSYPYSGDDDTTLEATVQTSAGLLTAYLELDSTASIEAGGVGGTTETAKFIGTATGDTSGDQFELTFVADGDVDWARVVDGRIECDGPIVVDMMYRYVAQLDFTDAAGFSTVAQSPDTDVTVKLARVPGEEPGAVNAGGPYSSIPTGTSGTVFDIDAVEAGITQSTRAAANDLLTIKATINAQGYDADSAPVTDGVLTGALAITITSLPLPDAPTLP